jgi:hypothetical protein
VPTEWLAAIAVWPVSTFLRDTTVAYAAVNAAHIFSIGLLVGAIITLDLRVLGLFRDVPVGHLAGPLSRVAAAGVGLAVATGFLLFSVRPAAYAANPAFLTKLSLLALGILNALVLRANRGWRAAVAGHPARGSVKAAALLSLLIWIGAVLAGRWIGFLQ